MTISISPSVQLSSAQNLPSVRINSAGNSTAIDPVSESTSSISTSTNSNSSTLNIITPPPIIKVKEVTVANEPALESPYIEITKQSTDSNNLNKQDIASLESSISNNSIGQISALNRQQQEINFKKTELSKQEQAIENQIVQLQQKEVEINRKKFQLQQSTGSLLNVQV